MNRYCSNKTQFGRFDKETKYSKVPGLIFIKVFSLFPTNLLGSLLKNVPKLGWEREMYSNSETRVCRDYETTTQKLIQKSNMVIIKVENV